MGIPVSLSDVTIHRPSVVEKVSQNLPDAEPVNIGLRLERMLWAEMLSHAGLEKAFTQGGGEAASAFSRYIVEAIASDLAEKHPLGFGKVLHLNEEVGNPAKLGASS